MKHYTDPLERISLIVSSLLTIKENNSDNTSRAALSHLSTATGLPRSVLKEDLKTLSRYPFFNESITLMNADGGICPPESISSCAGELFIDIDSDMFNYGYEENLRAVMLNSYEQMLLTSDAKYTKAYNAHQQKAPVTPVKVRMMIFDTSGHLINKLRSDTDNQNNMTFTQSENDGSVWYCEEIITDKQHFFKRLFGYGTSCLLLEPEYLIAEYTSLLKEIKKKL